MICKFRKTSIIGILLEQYMQHMQYKPACNVRCYLISKLSTPGKKDKPTQVHLLSQL